MHTAPLCPGAEHCAPAASRTPCPRPFTCREVIDSQWRPSKFTQAFAWSQLYTSSLLTLPNAIFTFLAFPALSLRFCERPVVLHCCAMCCLVSCCHTWSCVGLQCVMSAGY
jgi:hypothetical protein